MTGFVSVGAAGFEPAFSCVRGRRPLQASPRPEFGTVRVAKAVEQWCVCRSATGPCRREAPEGVEPSRPCGHPISSGNVCTLLLLGAGMFSHVLSEDGLWPNGHITALVAVHHIIAEARRVDLQIRCGRLLDVFGFLLGDTFFDRLWCAFDKRFGFS